MHGGGGTDDGGATSRSSSRAGHRLYNWNTTHFYPDVHQVDVNTLLVRRRHSEPDIATTAAFRFATAQIVSLSSQSDLSGSSSDEEEEEGVRTSSFSSSAELPAKEEDMPLSSLSIQLSPYVQQRGQVDQDSDKVRI